MSTRDYSQTGCGYVEPDGCHCWGPRGVPEDLHPIYDMGRDPYPPYDRVKVLCSDCKGFRKWISIGEYRRIKGTTEKYKERQAIPACFVPQYPVKTVDIKPV